MKEYVYPVRAVFASGDGTGKELVECGSCVAVTHRGGVVFITAAHVVEPRGRLKELSVLLDGNERGATVEKVESGLDAAVLRVPAYAGPGMRLAEHEARVHDRVFIFGYPLKYAGTALPRLIATGGRVVRNHHRHEGIRQAVLQVAGGSHFGGSGGAVVDADGGLLGMVFAGQFVAGEATHVSAIPSAALKQLLDR